MGYDFRVLRVIFYSLRFSPLKKVFFSLILLKKKNQKSEYFEGLFPSYWKKKTKLW